MDIKLSYEQKNKITVESLKENYKFHYSQMRENPDILSDKKILKALKRVLCYYMGSLEQEDYFKQVKNAHRSE